MHFLLKILKSNTEKMIFCLTCSIPRLKLSIPILEKRFPAFRFEFQSRKSEFQAYSDDSSVTSWERTQNIDSQYPN